jgi:hypothetical protein
MQSLNYYYEKNKEKQGKIEKSQKKVRKDLK